VLLNALAGASGVVLGVIPAGAGNDLAAAIGLPQDPLLAADLLLDGQPAFLDAALARTADGKERLYTGGAEWAWMPKPPVTLAVSIAICAAARAIFFPRYVP